VLNEFVPDRTKNRRELPSHGSFEVSFDIGGKYSAGRHIAFGVGSIITGRSIQASVAERQRVLPPEAGERVLNKPLPTNLLLASLSAADLKLLEPHLRPLELKQHKVL
jgi:hypothetical protein